MGTAIALFPIIEIKFNDILYQFSIEHFVCLQDT